jgi:hypothetical protein
MITIVYSVALVSLLVTATGSVESSSRPTSGLQVSSSTSSGTTKKVSQKSSSTPKLGTKAKRASVTTQVGYDDLCDQAESAIESGNFEKAAILASKAEGMRPDGWRGYFLVGRSAFYRDNAELADIKMRKALSLAPPSMRDGISRGIEAIQNLKLYTGYITEAESKKASGQVKEAAESFASAFRTSPTHYQIGLQAADLFDQLGQYDRELDILQSLSQVAVSESVRVRVSLAMSAAARKKDEKLQAERLREFRQELSNLKLALPKQLDFIKERKRADKGNVGLLEYETYRLNNMKEGVFLLRTSSDPNGFLKDALPKALENLERQQQVVDAATEAVRVARLKLSDAENDVDGIRNRIKELEGKIDQLINNK